MEKLENGRILITGGAGFIGSNLVRYLSTGNSKYDIVVLDNESLGKRENIGPYKFNFIKADITDSNAVTKAMDDVSCLIHLAADTRVMDSIANPAKNFEVNVVGTFRVLEAARSKGVRKIIFASTGGAILGDAIPPINEDMIARPLSAYGASKLAAEGYLSAYTGSYGIQSLCLRFSNVYGPGSFHKGSVVAHFFKRILKGENLTVYGDGSQKRDYLFITDLMRGIEAAIESDSHGVFQLGSGRPTTINELLDVMKHVVGEDFKSSIQYEDFRPGEVKETWCDIRKASRELAFSPQTSLKEGIQQTWNWFTEHYSR